MEIELNHNLENKSKLNTHTKKIKHVKAIKITEFIIASQHTSKYYL